ncbi:MAG: hypothetical protein R3D57_18485 [Hyphomicrobiaceae bacterium]
MQIEIKSQGLAAFIRELSQNADVTSTVIVGSVAVFLSYGLWKIGRGIVRANHAIRTRLETAKPVPADRTAFASAAPAELDAAPTLVRQWHRVDGLARGSFMLAGAARQSHDKANALIDALDFEMATLLAEVASVSSYAAGRTGRTETRPGPRALPATPRRPIAA